MNIDNLLQNLLQSLLAHMEVYLQLQEVLRLASIYKFQVLGQNLVKDKPPKPQMLADAQATVDKISANFRRGLITEEERYRAVVETWNETDKELTDDSQWFPCRP